MKTQHTPAPWRVREGALYKDGSSTEVNPNLPRYVCEHCHKEATHTHPIHISIEGKGWGVAQIGTLDPVREFDQHMANARLIAAAPDLLAALDAFLRAPSPGSSGPGSITIEVQTFNLDAARAAIAKARGEP